MVPQTNTLFRIGLCHCPVLSEGRTDTRLALYRCSSCVSSLSRPSQRMWRQDASASHSALHASSAASGFRRSSAARPRNACSFSTSSRMERSAAHQAPQKWPRCGASAAGQIHATRPSVIALRSVIGS